MKNKKLNLKNAQISAVVVLSLCMLCANSVKTYAQPTLSFTPSDGSTLTWMDISLQLKDYMGQGVYEPGYPFSAYTEAQKIDEVAFHLQPVVSISAPKVKEIGFRAFSGGIIAKVDLPSVERVEKEAFMACKSLIDITLPACIVVEESAFNLCTNLKFVELPNILDVHPFTFSGCTALIDAEIPQVRIIFESAFAGCTNLSSLGFLMASIGTGVETDASAILEYAFRNCKSIKKLFLPKLLVAREFCFSGCTGITELSLPVATKIESEAFGECSSLQKLSLPATEVIDRFAFVECTGLTELALPKIKTIGAHAFSGCPNIWKVSFGKGHTKEQIITLSEQIFGNSGMRAGGNVNPADIEIEIGENVMPKPQGNNWNGFTWKKVTVVPVVTGIEEVSVSNILNVYPNPVTDLLHIDYRAVARLVSVAEPRNVSSEYFIYNSVGQIVLKGKLHDEVTSLNVGFLPSGMYFLHVDGRTVKFLKR